MNLPKEDLHEVGEGTRFLVTPDFLRYVANGRWGEDDEQFVRDVLRKASNVIAALQETVASTRRVNAQLHRELEGPATK